MVGPKTMLQPANLQPDCDPHILMYCGDCYWPSCGCINMEGEQNSSSFQTNEPIRGKDKIFKNVEDL